MESDLLLQLLGILRGLQWSHWTTHWKVHGVPQYGDHLLFQRLYESMDEEIDTLGEKIVAYYGHDVMDEVALIDQAHRFLNLDAYKLSGRYASDMYHRALSLEQHLQRAITGVYDKLKESGKMSMGLDDFLMGMANNHETNIYLLRQRISGSATAP